MLSGNAFCLEKKIIRFRCRSMKFAGVVTKQSGRFHRTPSVIEADNLMVDNSYAGYLRIYQSKRIFLVIIFSTDNLHSSKSVLI